MSLFWYRPSLLRGFPRFRSPTGAGTNQSASIDARIPTARHGAQEIPQGPQAPANSLRTQSQSPIEIVCFGGRRWRKVPEIHRVVAERVGFEPTVPFQARRISSAVHSTTLPPLQAPFVSPFLKGLRSRARYLAVSSRERKSLSRLSLAVTSWDAKPSGCSGKARWSCPSLQRSRPRPRPGSGDRHEPGGLGKEHRLREPCPGSWISVQSS